MSEPWLSLVPLEPQHCLELYREELGPTLGSGWRFGGRTISYGEYVASLWADVLCNCAVLRPDGSLAGALLAYDADHRNGTVWVAAMSVTSARGSGLVLVGLAHLTTDLFREWRFERVLAETTTGAFGQFGSGVGRYFHELGRLRDDVRIDGELHDRIFLGVDREHWMKQFAGRYLRRRHDNGSFEPVVTEAVADH